ncbi:hypothetical protein H920_18000 [Fukomys damarensis]|uniref:Uncharacterized protein n=1 Tax=Fukomys damarensis TaxID=885580 RepID=A0A091CNR3_FUKDA|nr:hypothetical protein H920_18000 [Fukomys damarensis]
MTRRTSPLNGSNGSFCGKQLVRKDCKNGRAASELSGRDCPAQQEPRI